jgi:hypothetical protein
LIRLYLPISARLASAVDAEGNLCGALNHLNGTVYDYRAKPNIIYLINQEEEPPAKGTKRLVYGKCVSECPVENDILCQKDISLSENPETRLQQLLAGQCFRAYATHPVMNRCVPKELQRGMFRGASKSIKSVKYISRFRDQMYKDMNEDDFLTNVASDFFLSSQWIIICCMFAFGLGFIWLFLIQYLAFHMIWGTIFSSLILLAAATSYFWALAYQIELPFEAPSSKIVTFPPVCCDFLKVPLVDFQYC